MASRVAKAKKTIARRAARLRDDGSDLNGPSPNAATNLLIADLALRSGARLVRYGLERNYLGAAYSPAMSKAIVKGRGFGKSMLHSAVARVATRSVPGALLVGGGLIAKVIYDHQKGRKLARREGDRKMAEKAEASEDMLT